MKNKYEALIDDNINVSQTSDLKEFFILIGGVICVLIVLFFLSDFTADIYIATLSPEKQIKLEKALSYLSSDIQTTQNKKYETKLHTAERIKRRIIINDPTLRNKSPLPLYIANTDDINAFVTPDGKIYLTKGFLDEVEDSNELGFVLAHEIGHYAKKHHLHAISRSLIFAGISNVVSAGQSPELNRLVSGMSAAANVTYSQNQEREADRYANKAIKQIFGTNIGAIRFFRLLQKNENVPQFLYYFSTHPSTEERIKYLQNN